MFTAETQQSLLGLCTLLADHKANHGCKLVLGEDWAYVYTNNLELLSKFQAWPLVCRIEVREALCTIPRDVILQNQPEFRYRVYFRERFVSDDEKQRLRNWLNHQPLFCYLQHMAYCLKLDCMILLAIYGFQPLELLTHLKGRKFLVF